MANVINGIKINDTMYDLNLSTLGEQTSINFKSSTNDNVYEMCISGDGDIKLYDTENPYKDNIERWKAEGVDSGGSATANSNFPCYWKSNNELGGSFISNLFRINSCYFGGLQQDIDPNCIASHNYVELGNALDYDIKLNGVFLFYLGYDEQKWKYVALKGKIPAHGTYLIRGAQCGSYGDNKINVKEYDIEWIDSDTNEPIKFNDLGGGFYLALANAEGKIFDNDVNDFVVPSALSATNKYNSKTTHTAASMSMFGYIDLCGIYAGTTAADKQIINEAKPLIVNSPSKMKRCILFRKYGLDSGTATVLKNTDKRSTATFWTYCDFDKFDTDAVPYYSEEVKQALAPKPSFDPKTFGSWHTRFNKTRPNCINITLGKQGTDTGSGDAVRCFNWISYGCYDEYIEYKKTTDSTWKQKYSISKTGTHPYTTEYSGDNVVETFINQYDRLRWDTISGDNVTTHKAIIRNLSAGEYVFRVKRYNDPSYVSEDIKFVIKTDTQANTGFTVIHHSDQQGFSYEEYSCWQKTAYLISQQHPNIDFTINTGDMSQSGNREFEWIEYYRGKRHFGYGIPEMPIIGNNDLGCSEMWRLANGTANGTYPYYHAKINSMTIWLYYCFDLDAENSCIFEYKSGNGFVEDYIGINAIKDADWNASKPLKYFVPSLYSFNYGKFHFIMLNSEFATNAQSFALIYNNTELNADAINSYVEEFKGNVYYNIYKWLEKDYELYGSGKCNLVAAHEIPFCIVKTGAGSGTDYDGKDVTDTKNLIASPRSTTNTSKLNIDFSPYITTSPTTYANDAPDKDTKYKGGCCFTEFFDNNNIKLVIGGHKHTFSISVPTKENITYSGTERNVVPATPLLGNLNYDSTNKIVINDKANYTTYLMEQATGYKLTSNKDVPGKYLKWNYAYYETTSGGKCANGQQVPMYDVMTFNGNDNTILCEPHQTENVYIITPSVKAFEINTNNLSNASVKPITLSGTAGQHSKKVTGSPNLDNEPIKYKIKY